MASDFVDLAFSLGVLACATTSCLRFVGGECSQQNENYNEVDRTRRRWRTSSTCRAVAFWWRGGGNKGDSVSFCV